RWPRGNTVSGPVRANPKVPPKAAMRSATMSSASSLCEEAFRVFSEQQSASPQILCHTFYLGRGTVGIALRDWPPRIASRGRGCREGEERAVAVGELSGRVWFAIQIPAGERAARDGDIGQADAGDLIPVGIDLRHQRPPAARRWPWIGPVRQWINVVGRRRRIEARHGGEGCSLSGNQRPIGDLRQAA